MTENAEDLFAQGIARYKAGEDPQVLIPFFQDICDRAPKNPTAWTCLAWLYLLTDRPKLALKAAQKGVKFDKLAPQARINLVLAMLDSGEKGVREHIETIQQVISLDREIRQDVEENIADGLERKPDWKSLQRVKDWLS
jgi:tetratricopeptide (TPR) repeat protein